MLLKYIGKFVTDGVVFSFGVAMAYYIDAFGSSNTEVSLIISLYNGLAFCGSPVVSVLVNKYGARPGLK